MSASVMRFHMDRRGQRINVGLCLISVSQASASKEVRAANDQQEALFALDVYQPQPQACWTPLF